MSSSRFNSPGPTPHSFRHEMGQSLISSFHPARTTLGHPPPLSNLTNEQVTNLRRQSHMSTLSLSPGRPQPQSATTTGTARPGKGRERYSLADESSIRFDGVGEGGEGEEEEEFGMVDRIRCWRNDAMTQHLYGTAQFWGAKVFSMTGTRLRSSSSHPPDHY